MSAAGCLYPTSLCLPRGCGSSRGGPGQRAPVRPAGSESPLCALTGDQSRSSWTLWTEPLQPAACCTSSKVSLLHPSGLREFLSTQKALLSSCFWGCQPEGRGVGRTHPSRSHPSPSSSGLSRGSLTRAGLRACPEGRGSSGRPTSPGRASCPGLGQGRESRESPSCVGSAALVFTCFPLSFSTFPPRSSGCFPNIAAKVNGNPHSAPVRWVACLCSAPWLLRETLVLTRGWGAVGGLPGEGVWPGLE